MMFQMDEREISLQRQLTEELNKTRQKRQKNKRITNKKNVIKRKNI